MALTKKEQNFLKDLQSEEKLCAEKYRQAAESACDPALKTMLGEIARAEENHYDAVSQMLAGKTPPEKLTQPAPGGMKGRAPVRSTANRAGKKKDAYLLADLLATEKYVAGVYNTAVFEFSDEASRQALSGIQQQEQHHGKQLSDYMQANGMYC